MKKKKPILIVIAGPNGSGKTSITSKILKHEWIENCIVDRLYVYDNSVEYKNPKLLFRSVNGQIKKSYNRHHEWAMPIYENIYNK